MYSHADRVASYWIGEMNRDAGMTIALWAVAALALLIAWVRWPGRQTRSSSVPPTWALALLVALGIVARLAALPAENLWYDEAFTYVTAGQPLPVMLDALLGDVHPPLWYIISAPFAGGTDWLVRVPACAFSVATLLLFAWWLRRLRLGAPAELLALGMMALAPAQVRYGAEARMYAALEFAGLLMLVGLTLHRPRVLAAGVALAPWLQHVGGWLSAGCAVGIWVLDDPRVVRTIVTRLQGSLPGKDSGVGWLAGALAAAAPGLGMFGYQASTVATTGWYWLNHHTPGTYLHDAIWGQWFSGSNTFESLGWVAAVVGLGLGALAFASALWSLRARPTVGSGYHWAQVCALWAFGPGLALYMVSQWQPLLLPRVLLFTAPALYVLAARQLARWPRWPLRAVTIVMLALAAGGIAQHLSGQVRGADLDFFQQTRAAGCSSVVHSEPSSWLLAQVYAPDENHVLWDAFPLGLMAGAMSERTIAALGGELGGLDAGACLVYEDHAAVPAANIAELQRHVAGIEPALVLRDDRSIEVSVYRMEGEP